MKLSKIVLAFWSPLLIFPVPAQAIPETAEELRDIIQTEFAGDANAYVDQKSGDFRRMACRGRADLVQQLIDEGLVVSEVPFRTLERFYECAMDEAEWDALAPIIEPRTLATIERDANSVSLPLQIPVYGDDYQGTRLLIENGAHQIDNRSWTRGVFTEDGHRFLTVEWAVRQNHEEVVRAFEDAGFGEIVADARIPGLRALLYQLATGQEAGGGGGGFLAGIADIALGAVVGGSYTDFLLTSAGGTFIDSLLGGGEGEDPVLSPDGIDMQRRLSRYLTTVDPPVEIAPAPGNVATVAEEPMPSETATLSVIEELERLADLRDRGILSDEEFETMKDRILEGS